MANSTAKTIKEVFISLLEERPLSQITVKDIVEKCGINRNSFYYNFPNLPALINEIIKEDAEAVIAKYPTVASIAECFDVLSEFASHQKRAILHIFRSVDREVFERNLIQLSEYFVTNYVNTTLAGENIKEEEKKTIITYYNSLCFGLVIGWLNSGMNNEYASEIRWILRLKNDGIKEFVSLMQQPAE